MSEPLWIRNDVALAIHRRQLAEHGGQDGVRDPGLLQSALARPKNLHAYQPDRADLPALAASYAYGIAKNHPFLDGNKRTALVVCRTSLRLNGWDLDATQEDKYLTFLRLAEGRLTEEALVEWLRGRCRLLGDGLG